MEQWKDIPGYEGRYQVSDLGRVKGPKGVMTPSRHRDGYLQLRLCAGPKQSTRSVHRLVAAAFCAPGGPEVDHIDMDKTNNRASNLRWVDRRTNMLAAFAAGLRPAPNNAGHLNPMARLTVDDVLRIREQAAGGAQAWVLASNFGVAAHTIRAIVRRARWANA